jgi:gliding motility-associated-like protein
VSRINSPNLSGAACNYESNAIRVLSGTLPRIGLPTDVVFPYRPHEYSIIHDTICYSHDSEHVPKVLSAPTGYDFYEWNNGTTDNTFKVSASGVYWVKYQKKACGAFYTDTFYVEVIDLTFSLGADTTMFFCDHPQSYLQLNVSNIEKDATYFWQDGSSVGHYRVTAPGIYWVKVSKGGCVVSDTIKVKGVEPSELKDTIFCKGERIDILLHAPDVPSSTIIQWSTGSSDPYIHVTDSGLYWLRLINPPCMQEDSMYVKMEVCECFANIGNAFSPNGDGKNDVFLAVIDINCPIRDYKFSIYNRFGQRVFFSVDPNKGWDGYHNGIPADIGTYFYELHLYSGKTQRAFYSRGDITLLR